MIYRLALITLLTIFVTAEAFAGGGAYSYDIGNNIIGMTMKHRIAENESLHEVARKYDLGYNEIVAANPGIDPWLPKTGLIVNIPTRWIIPHSITEGVVINLAEMRLFYLMDFDEIKLAKTYPIGIGKEGDDTPLGVFHVIQKTVKPTWHVPKSIREEDPTLPEFVLPGPENPLGSHAIRLSDPSYLIHGTNKPFGIGRRVSHGCIRLYPEDIKTLFGVVDHRDAVQIVYQPIKIGIDTHMLHIEVHEDYRGVLDDMLEEALSLITKYIPRDWVDEGLLNKILKEKKGVPIPIARVLPEKFTESARSN